MSFCPSNCKNRVRWVVQKNPLYKPLAIPRMSMAIPDVSAKITLETSTHSSAKVRHIKARNDMALLNRCQEDKAAQKLKPDTPINNVICARLKPIPHRKTGR